MPQQTYKFVTTIDSRGKIEVNVPLAPGTPVEVLVLSPNDDYFLDLVAASTLSLDFWMNEVDDEDWNDA
jgi:hypothetical protein